MKTQLGVLMPAVLSLCLASGPVFAKPAAPVAPEPPAATAAPTSPADASDFCPSLGVYLASAGEQFASVTGADIIPGLAWSTTKSIAAADGCYISKSYLSPQLSAVCSFSPGTTDAAAVHESLVALVRTCGSGWTRDDTSDSAGIRTATLSNAGGARVEVETKPLQDGAVPQLLRIYASAAPAAPVATAAAPSPSDAAGYLSLNFSDYDWGHGSSPAATVTPAPHEAAPPAPTSDYTVSDAEYEAEVARIRAKVDRYMAPASSPTSADMCTGLQAYVAAAPDYFKAVRATGPQDGGSTHEWKASPALARWDACTITEATEGFLSTDSPAMRTYLSCNFFAPIQVDYAGEYASLTRLIESCFPQWKKDVKVDDKNEKHWKTSYGATSGAWISVEQWLEHGGYKQALRVYRD